MSLTHSSGADITSGSKPAECERERSENQLRSLIDCSCDLMTVIDSNGVALFSSRATEKILGYPLEEVVGRNAFEIIHRDDAGPTRAALEASAGDPSKPVFVEHRLRRRDGSWRLMQSIGRGILWDGKTPAVAVNSRDITESRQRDGQLRQAEKMEALGRLTGGLAHDYNNLLMIINGCSEVALDAPGAPPEMLEMLRQIYAAGERAAKLTRQLLTFSQKQVARRERANLNDILAEIVKTLPPMMGGDISLELKPHPGLPPILADAAMIDQAVMNLALNARDAMPQGGTLLLATEPVLVSETDARNWGAGRAGEFVCLVVKDSGAGIPAEILPQVFEPFFTTKAEGEGPGLGLSTVFGIVKQHLGWLTVESEPGHGSAFRIYLPAESPVAAQPGGEAARAKGSGAKVTVLVVEDEDALRELAVVMLEKLGYRALQAADGDEALEVWQRHGHRIDLLLTDIVMPGSLTGRQLAEQLQGVKPSLKVIYSSGCATASAGEMLGIRESALFLQKPYSPRNLAEALRFCFDTKATTS